MSVFESFSTNNLALMQNRSGVGGLVQGTLNYLLAQGMIAITIHLASNKCQYV